MPGLVACLSFLALAGWAYLALCHGHFWQPLRFEASPEPASWPTVDIIVPARNEADILPHTLLPLLAQDYPGDWRVILIDDHSDDQTAEVARRLAARTQAPDRLTVIEAPEPPPGWTGKLAAMQAGVASDTADYILFTDADIRHPPGGLRRLVARALDKNLDLVSLMVRLRCQSTAEKFLIPAFVFFFAMLYPFRRSNDPVWRTAAAAGGVMLVKRETLIAARGLARIKDELIDDCALARIIKSVPGQIELTLADDVHSLRPYRHVADVREMIARNAFTQLDYSPFLLAAAIAGMGLLFLLPVVFFFTAAPGMALTGFAMWLLMAALYAPTVRFYGLPSFWALTLPAAALVYVAATIDSARLYWQGKGGQWKGRAQA